MRLEVCKLWAEGSGIVTGSSVASEPALKLCIFCFVADCRFVSPFPKALFVLKRDELGFPILLFDAVASSALTVATLWTKVAPRHKLFLFFFFLRWRWTPLKGIPKDALS